MSATIFRISTTRDITARLCRVQEIPGYICDGVLDVVLIGKDWLLKWTRILPMTETETAAEKLL